MSAPAAALIRITFRDMAHHNFMGTVTADFAPDSTWLQVVEHLVRLRVRTLDMRWHISGMTIGKFIPLTDKLSVWGGRVDWSKLMTTNMLSFTMPHLTIRYALAAARAGLKWPLFDEQTDKDIFNSEALGGCDDWLMNRGATLKHKEESNIPANLVCITNRSGVIHCCNKFKLLHFVLSCMEREANILDPFFNQPMHIEELTHLLAESLLPVYNVDTRTITNQYSDALKAVDEWMKSAEGQAKANEENASLDARLYRMVASSSAIARKVIDLTSE